MTARGRAGAEELRRLLRESVSGGAARNVLWLRLADLPDAYRKPHHLRLAHAALEPLMVAERARAFELPDGDPILVWRGPAEAEFEACQAAIAHLFADAELPDPAALLCRMTLPGDAATLAGVIDRAGRPAAPPAATSVALAPLDPPTLAALEARLAGADMARFARRRDVCAIVRGRFAARWEERFLSIEELAATLAPEHDLRADPWLFRRLTRTLDQRLLALLAAGGELRGAGPFAIDLNLSSILAPEFLRFDTALPPALRGEVRLGVAPADMLADPTGFRFAADFSRARGYRLVLRDVTAELLDVLAVAAPATDLVEVRWSPDLAARTWPALDPARAVLAGVDDVAALDWGTHHGLALFRGGAVGRDRAVPAPAWPAQDWPDRPFPPSRNLALGGVATAA